jgi:cell division protein FtsI (penicillin-binding protein 3)
MISAYKNSILSIFFFFCFGYLIVIANLFYLQCIQHTFFTQLGQRQYHITITTLPARGIVTDRTGKKFLALNKDSIAAFILPQEIKNRAALEAFLLRYFPAAHQRLKDHPTAYFLYVQRRLTPQQIDLIKQKNIVDIQFLQEPSRYYPLPYAAPIIGITDIDNKGLSGIELQFDALLGGNPTIVHLEKDARSNQFYFNKETTHEGSQSSSLSLTIDSDLQFLAHEMVQEWVDKYHAQSGAALIMNPDTGEILALVSVPTFDPNNNQHDAELLTNPVVTHAYELGSVFKIFTALAALEEDLVTLEELIDCKDALTAYIDGRKINTTIAAGIIPFKEVIAQSNNIGIAQVAQRLGSCLYDHYVTLGFGKKTGIAFPGEAKGFINPPNLWSKQSIISLSYGYEIAATLLQLARAFCVLANGGYLIEPQLLLNQKKVPHKKLYRDTSIALTQELLEQTTKQGTARKAHIKGYKIMCKTGTANMLENGVYNPDKNIFTCAGIVQKDNYNRVIVVFIKEAAQKDLYASTVTAPLFEKIAEKMIIKDRVFV